MASGPEGIAALGHPGDGRRRGRNEAMEASDISVIVGKEIAPEELAALFGSVGWGEASDGSSEPIRQSLASYPFIAHARDQAGRLVGYASAFSDGAFSTFLGELVVHPEAQRLGVGRKLLAAVEAYAGGVPIYVKTFDDQAEFFRKQGYRTASRPMSILFKVKRTRKDHRPPAAGGEADPV